VDEGKNDGESQKNESRKSADNPTTIGILASDKRKIECVSLSSSFEVI
jgi:hypothetical protein